MEKILELRRKRAALIDQMRELLDVAEKEDRDLSGEETEKYDRMLADEDSMRQRIERLERQAGLDKSLGDAPVVPPHIGEPDEEPEVRGRGTPEYRDAFDTYLRGGNAALFPEHVRSLNIGADADGGYLVPDEFMRLLIEALEERNVMRSLARVIRTSHGTTTVPVVVDKGVATWLGEEQPYTESDAEFAQTTLGAHKLGRITKVSEELLHDSAFSIEEFLADAFGRTFGDAEEKAFIDGVGETASLKQPRGFLLDAEVGKTAAAPTAITTDELLDVYHALRPPYRPRASWMMHDSTVLALRKLKDADGQYIWQPGLQAGQPDRILGRPVIVSRYMPELKADAKAVAFGDYGYYWIADRQSIGIQRLVELYAASGQVGFRMFERVDGRLILPEAVQVLKQGA